VFYEDYYYKCGNDAAGAVSAISASTTYIVVGFSGAFITQTLRDPLYILTYSSYVVKNVFQIITNVYLFIFLFLKDASIFRYSIFHCHKISTGLKMRKTITFDNATFVKAN
jgi:hypothetical protein